MAREDAELVFDAETANKVDHYVYLYELRFNPVHNDPGYQLETIIRLPEGAGPDDHYLRFLCNRNPGKGWDNLGSFMADENLESRHNIARVLPTDHASEFDSGAFLLTKDEVKFITEMHTLKWRCFQVISKVAEHFGIECNIDDVSFKIIDGRDLSVITNGPQRLRHNQRRVTRLLRFLKIFSVHHAFALLQFLAKQMQLVNLVVSQDTFNHWEQAVMRPSRLSL